MYDIKYGMLQVRENEISLRKGSGGTAQLHSLEGTLIVSLRVKLAFLPTELLQSWKYFSRARHCLWLKQRLWSQPVTPVQHVQKRQSENKKIQVWTRAPKTNVTTRPWRMHGLFVFLSRWLFFCVPPCEPLIVKELFWTGGGPKTVVFSCDSLASSYIKIYIFLYFHFVFL